MTVNTGSMAKKKGTGINSKHGWHSVNTAKFVFSRTGDKNNQNK